MDTILAHHSRMQKTPYVKGSLKDLRTNFTGQPLEQLWNNLHNVLWGGGSTGNSDVFFSLTNLILAKIQDEDEKKDGEPYDFQIMIFAENGNEESEANEILFDRINNLYRRALKTKLYILDEDKLCRSYVIDTKSFSLSKLKQVVQTIEGFSFINCRSCVNGDILGSFFEKIIQDDFKQSKGQFFTHVNIVRFMLYALQVDRLAIQSIRENGKIPYMIDPSAGSGTYLVEYMKFITKNIKYRNRNENGYNAGLGTAQTVRARIQEWFYPDNNENRWAQEYIYGTEINFNLATAAKVNMILHSGGSGNIYVKDGLASFSKYDRLNALNISMSDPLYRLRGDALTVNEQFDLILTNPPFSAELDNDTKKTVKSDFMFGEKKNSENLSRRRQEDPRL